MRIKKLSGDTLVEVMFAVGLFSMIVISSITVMNRATNEIQRDLEITMTRNEIDTQAETLRFIHDSYEAELPFSEEERKYESLWNEIVKKTISSEDFSGYVKYAPQTCAELYDENGEVKKYGFILNYRNLTKVSPSEKDDMGGGSLSMSISLDDKEKVFYTPGSGSVVFQPTTLYPRLMFRSSTGLPIDEYDEDQFYNDLEENTYEMNSADGLYVIGVKDSEGKYYDFYIRTCWQSSDEGIPTLTSTVIRLYNPDINIK